MTNFDRDKGRRERNRMKIVKFDLQGILDAALLLVILFVLLLLWATS